MTAKWVQILVVAGAAVGALAVVVLAAPAGRDAAARVSGEVALAADMAEAARRFLAGLNVAQRKRAGAPFAGGERTRWHYVPRQRGGVTIGELDDAQRHLAYGFLTTALSRKGFLKASTIMALEEVLRRRSGGAGLARDPGAYFLSVYGEPSTLTTWGWRLEGHHLSINATLVDGVRLVVAPTFLGANPAHTDGEYLGHTRVLGREEELGAQLVGMLDDEQRRAAVYNQTPPGDILTGPGSDLAPLPGLPTGKLTAEQRPILQALVDEILGHLPPELLERERARLAAHGGAAQLTFTWAGPTAITRPHYFRLAGPTFLYELDNTQEDANHVHSVWHARDEAGGDFGADLLRRHVREEPHGLSKPELEMLAEIRGAWSRPVEPFHIVGNIYYVGAANIAAYLIAGDRGLILIDTGTREMEPVVRAGIVKLGFELEDVKLILTSHAHFDHVEGLAAMQRLTGAKIAAMAAEVPALSSGEDLSALGALGWEPVAVDRVLRDGEDVVLGDVTLRALWTPGHTQGATSFLMTTREAGRSYQVLFLAAASPNAGVTLVGNPRHPSIVDDFARTHRVLEALTPDIFLTFHPEDIFAGKMDRLRGGGEARRLVDPKGYAKAIAEAKEDTRRALQIEAARGRPR